MQVDPVLVRAAAAQVDALLPALRIAALDPADLAALGGLPGGAAFVAEHDQLTADVARTGRALADLAAGLRAAADGVAAADRGIAAALDGVPR